ncbi:mechanosensitive ion channel family protein [Candidatus Woesearchaeota archaeon]|nr:mechanosensitive ion channel family protein [Candidatus Woesearchaeota archaeon]
MIIEPYIPYLKQNNYLYSLVILIVFFILSKLMVFISQKIILQLTKKTKTDIDDLIVKRTNKPISLILVLIGFRLALFPLGIKQTILDILENTISSLIIIIVTYIIIAVTDIIIDNWSKKLAEKTESEIDDDLIPLFHRFSRIVISIVGLLFVLPAWGIQIGPLLTSLGIAGVAIAFALQTTLGNIFGGVSIILDKSIKVGDKIKLDADTMGTVMDVGLRSTKINTWDNELITIPNGKLADSKILNFIQPDPSIRIAVDFGVEYGSEAPRVRKVVLDALSKIHNVLRKPEPQIMFMEMADFALKFRALFWVGTFDEKFQTKCVATEEIYNALRKANIGIPFPTRTLHIVNEKARESDTASHRLADCSLPSVARSDF